MERKHNAGPAFPDCGAARLPPGYGSASAAALA